MVRENPTNVAAEARAIYESRLKSKLMDKHQDEFVAIEPQSGDFFLGKTLSEVIGASREKYPDRLAHALRIGHQATVHFGLHIQ